MKKPWNYIDPPRSRLPYALDPAEKPKRIGYLIAVALAVGAYVVWMRL